MTKQQYLETELIAVDPNRPETAVLQHAATILRGGGLVAFPTETVYGLGANALDETAVRRIFAAKQRPAYDPIIVHVADLDGLAQVAADVPQLAQRLAAAFWPGALTLVLPKAAHIPAAITAGGDTVAVRCPSHPLAQALIRTAGLPIGAPSANQFSHTSPTTAQHVWHDLAGRVDLILDGGATSIGVESTVLDVTGAVPVLLRPGGVTLEALTAVVADIIVPQPRRLAESEAASAPVVSPGMLDRHYAPRTPLWLFTGSDTAVRQEMRALLDREVANGRLPALLLAAEDAAHFADYAGAVRVVGSLHNLPQIAQNLFTTIRQLDETASPLILARDVPGEGIGRAVRDRLRRAADRVVHPHLNPPPKERR